MVALRRVRALQGRQGLAPRQCRRVSAVVGLGCAAAVAVGVVVWLRGVSRSR